MLKCSFVVLSMKKFYNIGAWSDYVDGQAEPSHHWEHISFEPVHEISNNVVCATSKASDQPAHTRSLIRAFASRLSIR